MQKILFVINTMGTAGAEKALLEILRRLDGEKYEVSLFVLCNQGELIKDVPKSVRLINKNYDDSAVHGPDGIKRLKKYVRKSFLRHGSLFKNIPYLTGNLSRMKREKRVLWDKLLWKSLSDGAPRIHEEFDYAISFIEGGSTYYVSKYVKAKQKIAFVHIDYMSAGYTRELDGNCYDSFQKVFAVSHEVKASFLRVHPECTLKTEVFHNLLNHEEIKRKALVEGGLSDPYKGFRILSIGRLNTQKAFDLAIDAMRLIKAAGIEARWYVLGEGNQREYLQNRIQLLHLENDFLLLGNIANPYVFLKQCDVYVHASKYEGKSIAVQEARILGCPIVVTDYAGNGEQIENGVDGVVCSFDGDAIAEAVIDLLKHRDKAQTLGKEAARRIELEKDTEDLDRLFN